MDLFLIMLLCNKVHSWERQLKVKIINNKSYMHDSVHASCMKWVSSDYLELIFHTFFEYVFIFNYHRLFLEIVRLQDL